MNFMHKFSWFTLAAAMAFVGYYGFCMLYPYKIIDFKQPARILTPIVKNGGEVIYEIEYCKHTTKSAIMSRTLVDTVRFNLGAFRSNVPCGCHTSRSIVKLPSSIELNGKFHLEFSLEYQVNPFRTIILYAESEEFEIVE